MNYNFILIRRHWKPLFILNLVLMGATAYLLQNADKFFQPVWKADAQLNIPSKGGNLRADLGTLGNLTSGTTNFSQAIDPLAVQMAILTSNAVLQKARLADPEKSLYPKIEDYKGLFTITPQEKTAVLLIETQASSPEIATKRLKALVESYQQRLDQLRYQDAETRERFAQKELNKAKNNLNQAEKNLAGFQRSTQLVNPEAQTRALAEAMRDLQTKQAELAAEAQGHQTEVKIAAMQLGVDPKQAVNTLRLAENKEYQAVRDKLSQVEIELSQARGLYTERMPAVKSLLLQREQLLGQLNQQVSKAIPGISPKTIDATLSNTGNRLDLITGLVKSQIAAKGLQQQTAQMQNQIAQFSAELNFIANNQTKLLDLQRKYDIAEGVYKGIIAQINQAKIDTFESYPNVQLIDGPTLNSEPTQANPNLILLGSLLAALFGSVSLAMFLESRNPLLNPKDLQQAAFPMVIGISRLRSLSLEKGLDSKAEREFQRLAAIVSSMMLENRRLMFTSATFGEGKTSVTLGLAWALVQLGFRVLVVDADLRQAEMSRRLGYSQFRKTEQEPLTLLPIHPGFDLMLAPLIQPNKIGEFFVRGEFERRLNRAQASDDYDYVLVDSPPVNLVSEAALMSRLVQNVMYVVRPGTSDRYAVIDSLEQLKQQEAQIKGLIVNGVETRTASYRYYGNRQELPAEEV